MSKHTTMPDDAQGIKFVGDLLYVISASVSHRDYPVGGWMDQVSKHLHDIVGVPHTMKVLRRSALDRHDALWAYLAYFYNLSGKVTFFGFCSSCMQRNPLDLNMNAKFVPALLIGLRSLYVGSSSYKTGIEAWWDVHVDLLSCIFLTAYDTCTHDEQKVYTAISLALSMLKAFKKGKKSLN